MKSKPSNAIHLHFSADFLRHQSAKAAALARSGGQGPRKGRDNSTRVRGALP